LRDGGNTPADNFVGNSTLLLRGKFSGRLWEAENQWTEHKTQRIRPIRSLDDSDGISLPGKVEKLKVNIRKVTV